MDVFVVTQGEYSHYHICGIFSTREKAEEFFKDGNNEGYAGERTIEEWSVDDIQPLIVGPQWWAGLRLNGDVEFEQLNDDEEHHRGEVGQGSTNDVIEREADFFKYYCTPNEKNNSLFTGMSYLSAEHAMKLAAEQRQQFLRERPEMYRKGMEIWNAVRSQT